MSQNTNPFNLATVFLLVGAIAAIMSTYGGEKPAHASSKIPATVFLDGQP
jgi:hypothetical protein